MISDDEFESILRDALVDYVGETPDYPGELSPKYQRRFKRMLADPVGYVKRRQHRPWHYVIAALVVLTVGAVAFCAPQTRVIADNMFTGLHGGFNSYRFAFPLQKQGEIVLPEIEIGYVPEGYTLEYSNEDEAGTRTVWQYENSNEEVLTVSVSLNNNSSVYNDSEYHAKKYIALNSGKQATLLLNADKNRRNIMFWTESNDKIALKILANLPEEELIKIANNIEFK